MGVESCFEGGMRISSPEVVEVAEMVLCGHINKYISSGICSSGGNSLGISGRDANILRCKKLLGSNGFDLGNVGEIVSVNKNFGEYNAIRNYSCYCSDRNWNRRRE